MVMAVLLIAPRVSQYRTQIICLCAITGEWAEVVIDVMCREDIWQKSGERRAPIRAGLPVRRASRDEVLI